jgi:phospholipase/lecithinase/hemolysin
MHKMIWFRTRSLPTASFISGSDVRSSRRFLTLAFVFLLGCVVSLAQARNYTRIVVFGDSLSDTGNVAHLSTQKLGVPIPGPFVTNYTLGRFTDGPDTNPAAVNYFGVWVEQLAAQMPSHPEVKNSLDGGTNYSYGFAFTGDGTTTLDFGPGASVDVENMGQQVSEYLATNPTIDKTTLFIVWGGANNLNYAASSSDVVNAAISETLDIQRLINAGATQFLVLNLPPLGLIPRFNGSPASSVPANAAAALFNSWLETGISVLHDFYGNSHLVFTRVDIYSLFNQIAAHPEKFALANVTGSSWYLGVDPDTYLFWDDLHPTTRGHNLVANAVMKAMASPQCTSYGLPACAAAVNK